MDVVETTFNQTIETDEVFLLRFIRYDLSKGNNLTVFPEIEGCSLKILDLSNNKISSINVDLRRDLS